MAGLGPAIPSKMRYARPIEMAGPSPAMTR